MVGRNRTKTVLTIGAAALFFLGVCRLAALVRPSSLAQGATWHGIVPPLLAVTLALLSGRLRLCLGAAVLVGGMLGAARDTLGPLAIVRDGLAHAGTFVVRSVWPGDGDTVNLQILLYVVLIMAMIAVMQAGGGLQGVARWLTRFARSRRSAGLVTFVTGLVIFIDDYANTMIVGSTLRPMTDRHGISREKLAFLVDATAAPVAGLAVISTWIGYEVGLLSTCAESLNIAQDGYSIFFDALGYRFYCMGMIAFVFFNALSDRDIGPMAEAQRRAIGPDATDGSPVAMSGHASVAIVPMGTLLVVFLGGLWLDGGGLARMSSNPMVVFQFQVWREVLSEADSIPLLACASACGLVMAVVLALGAARCPVAVTCKAVLAGVKTSLLPVSVLILAWSLKGSCDQLQTGKFLAGILADSISPQAFPALVFVVAGLAAFATGTSWGTMAILIPTALPVAHALDGGAYGLTTVISVAAILDGSIFGDHCSPISDTTIMSSTASSCDHLAHVRTQMPYSLLVAAMVLCVGYLPAALGVAKWGTILAVLTIPGVFWLIVRTKEKRGHSTFSIK